MLSTILLAIRLAMVTGSPDAFLFAQVCTDNATPLVSAERLCSVAYVESRLNFRAHNAGGHCGAWQQHPTWSGMFGDDCYSDSGQLLCRQPGGLGVECEALMDATLAGRVAARHLHYLTRRHGSTRSLCRYAGATGERCSRYRNAVMSMERKLTEYH